MYWMWLLLIVLILFTFLLLVEQRAELHLLRSEIDTKMDEQVFQAWMHNHDLPEKISPLTGMGE
jgi:predicted Holliday junction resolvase-like endonuclease